MKRIFVIHGRTFAARWRGGEVVVTESGERLRVPGDPTAQEVITRIEELVKRDGSL